VLPRVARQLGVGGGSQRPWVKLSEVHGDTRPGATTSEDDDLVELSSRRLRKEVRKLRPFDDIHVVFVRRRSSSSAKKLATAWNRSPPLPAATPSPRRSWPPVLVAITLARRAGGMAASPGIGVAFQDDEVGHAEVAVDCSMQGIIWRANSRMRSCAEWPGHADDW
jgi:hypothetical protein